MLLSSTNSVQSMHKITVMLLVCPELILNSRIKLHAALARIAVRELLHSVILLWKNILIASTLCKDYLFIRNLLLSMVRIVSEDWSDVLYDL